MWIDNKELSETEVKSKIHKLEKENAELTKQLNKEKIVTCQNCKHSEKLDELKYPKQCTDEYVYCSYFRTTVRKDFDCAMGRIALWEEKVVMNKNAVTDKN